jgi:NAD(P)H dehydrogenase (quinone)
MYAILGATGRIGGTVATELRRRGHAVRAVVRNPEKAKDLYQNGCEVRVADVRDEVQLTAALSGATHVFVICPMDPTSADPRGEHLHTIETIGRALEAARPRFILAISDYGAHHDRGTGITLTFHWLEERLKSIPASCTIVRSAEHMQNWKRYFKSASQTGVLPVFYRPRTRPLPIVSSPDVGLVAAKLLAHDTRITKQDIVHVEGPERYSIEQIAAAMRVALSRDIEVRDVASERWIDVLTQAGLSGGYSMLLSEMYSAHNEGLIEVEGYNGDVRKGKTTISESFA